MAVLKEVQQNYGKLKQYINGEWVESKSTRIYESLNPATGGVIVVDLQGDFTSWKNGSLACNSTDKAYVDKVVEATEAFSKKGYLIFATQDWHPVDHRSFFSNHPGKKPFEAIKIEGRTQVLWPPHCVQGTENAKILVDNNLFQAVVKKGKNPRYDSYSGFQDDGGDKTEVIEAWDESSEK